ncbi:MAG TPA: hypothetical protein VIJ75_11095 [Hanamia sp.]
MKKECSEAEVRDGVAGSARERKAHGFVVQDSKALNNEDSYFFCWILKRVDVPRSIAKCISEAE